jgi:hypothetical protein
MAFSKPFVPTFVLKPMLVVFATAAITPVVPFASAARGQQVCETENLGAAGTVRGCYTATPTPAPTRPQGPTPEDQRRQREVQRQRDITWFSEEGADYARRGDWPNAVRSLEEALDHDPDNEDLARDLASARSEMARAAASAAQARAAASAAQARAAASAAQARAAALAAAAVPRVTARPVNMDSSVVDAREASRRRAGRPLDGLPRLELMENSPGREAWLRGMDAIVHRDWPLALAWFRTAQRLDPTNPALARAVILAAWTMDRQRPLDLPGVSDYEMFFVDRSAVPAAAAAARQPYDSSGLQLPVASDAEFLFNPEVSEAARLVEEWSREWEDSLMPPATPQAIAMHDRRLVGVGRAIAEASASGGVMTDAENARIDAERLRAAQGLDEDARLLLSRGDVAGAAALAYRANVQVPENPRYRTLRDTLRSMLIGNRGNRQPTPAAATAVRRPRN